MADKSATTTSVDASSTLMMSVDLKRCIGCDACSVACMQENKLRVGMAWNRVYGSEIGGYPLPDVRVLPMLCQQCPSAWCQTTCDALGHDAIRRRPDGIVYVDQAKCVGCEQCVPACPFKAILFNPETNKAEKCHFCMHRIDAGLLPACVITCLGITRTFGTVADVMAKHPSSAAMVPRNANVVYEHLGGSPAMDRATAGYPGAAEYHT